VAFNQRVATARDQIASVRANAEAQAVQLEQARQQAAAAASSLRSQVAGWEQQVTQLQEAQAQESQQAAAAQAQQTVSSWVGSWAIPQAIVMCESGGNFGAVNPSSGAGGAYQILPSTWDLYGGQGEPQNAPKAEQDRIAAEIWADSGGSAWVCAG
jgi:multidrug efflux pump subunit AcrA (membrane-fusion protein)